MKQTILFFFILLQALVTFADGGLRNLSDGKDFIPWVFEDQISPTITRSYDTTGLSILFAGAASTAVAHQYDDTVRRHNLDPDRRIFDKDTANFGGYLGSGGPGIGIALMQLYLDRENGLQHARALALTAGSHITLASIINRQRPNERDYLSMPSGHASSAFATATSLAYSYGWTVGVPAYLAAGFIAATRVSENIHWTSDVVAAAALGIYWGRASALVTEDRKSKMPLVMPVKTEDGAMLTANWEF
jgi:membrane-associated phospholipid phosphatase